METATEVRHRMDELQHSVWELAALALVLRGDAATNPDQRRHAEQVVVEMGLMAASPEGTVPTPGLAELIAAGGEGVASEAVAPLLQCAALLSGTTAWTDQGDGALLAQGRSSAQVAAGARRFLLPALEGLDELMGRDSAAMLDVGVGVAAMAVEYCRCFPTLRVVGIDVSARILELARRVLAEAGMADRIELRHQDVAALDDRDSFCLAWVPTPFVRRSCLEAGVVRAAAALVPGGWLVLGHGKYGADPLLDAVNRFRTTAFGGSAVDADTAQRLLQEADLDAVRTLATPEGAPGLTVGRRPTASA